LASRFVPNPNVKKFVITIFLLLSVLFSLAVAQAPTPRLSQTWAVYIALMIYLIWAFVSAYHDWPKNQNKKE
jgi:predicted branched-subunit amino acid permease